MDGRSSAEDAPQAAPAGSDSLHETSTSPMASPGPYDMLGEDVNLLLAYLNEFRGSPTADLSGEPLWQGIGDVIKRDIEQKLRCDQGHAASTSFRAAAQTVGYPLPARRCWTPSDAPTAQPLAAALPP
jgi:hypothetical protein